MDYLNPTRETNTA